VEGAPNCSRLGCAEAATALFAFDARECLVWIDPLDEGARGAGVLCDQHADHMSPPRGWNLLDRRSAESRLWIGRAAPDPAPLPPRTRRATPPTRPRSVRTTPSPRLPFEATPARTGWSPHDRPGPELEHVLDARTPLLARAFEAARPTNDVEEPSIRP
jgi:hypothetical protein